MFQMHLVAITLLLLAQTICAEIEIGYDCGNPLKILTVVSLSNLPECDITISEPKDIDKEIQCEIKKRLRSDSAFLTSQPDELAFTLMNGPGYMAKKIDESLFVGKCTPVETTTRQVEDCYKELPVFYNNEPYYLAPKTKLLIKTGTPRDCSSDKKTSDPEKPYETWSYKPIPNLATAGIYSQKELDKYSSQQYNNRHF